MKLFRIKALLLILTALTIASCSSAKNEENRSVDKVFQDAVEKFNKDELLEAQSDFDIIKIQYPASQYADDAQFYLAEISYKRELYIQSAFNYNYLRRMYPGSDYVKTSLYKAAMSYYQLSPPFDRDQDYTRKAIQAFQEFQYLYPEDSLTSEAGAKIIELREKLAEREFFTATLYMKMDSPKSAVIYYNAVIDNFNDTKFYEDAIYGKIQALKLMNKNEEARAAMETYKKKFPAGKHISELEKL
ncbi:MAG: outer membrane protein assembly factor BamD [Chloroflexota bacterium]